MPFTSQELNRAGKIGLDFFMANDPIDNVAVERPWLRKLMTKRRPFPGGKQYIVEQLRYRYQSNFQFYYGDQQVSYNKRSTIEQAQFEWKGAHDGYSLNEDELLQNGITIADSAPKTNTKAERLQLTNLFKENNAVLRLGFEEVFDAWLLGDKYSIDSDGDAIRGLDYLVDMSAGSTVGGINSTNETWWDNYSVWNNAAASKNTSITSSTVIAEMEIAWRTCIRNGGVPDFIMAGSEFIDTFRTAAAAAISRYTVLQTSGQQASMDPTIGPVQGVETGLHFQGVPIIWNPVFQDMDATYDASATRDWEQRCYILNTRHIRLRPAQGHDMVTRNPPRVYDRYAYYFGLSWKGALCTDRRNAHAVIAID